MLALEGSTPDSDGSLANGEVARDRTLGRKRSGKSLMMLKLPLSVDKLQKQIEQPSRRMIVDSFNHLTWLPYVLAVLYTFSEYLIYEVRPK